MKRLADTAKRLNAGERLIRRNPLFYSRATALFDRLEAVALEERRSFTEKRLREVLATASTSRYGRSVRRNSDIASWPVLEKEAVRDDPKAYLGPRHRLASHALTSGTTGTPLALLRSPQSLAFEQAAIDRLARTRGHELARARVVVLRGDDIARPGSGDPFWEDRLGGRRRVFSSNDLAPGTLDAFADAVDEFRPDCMLAYPSVLESLCRLLQNRKRHIRVPLTMTSSEVLSPQTRQLARDVVGTDVVDYYGQAERVAFAASLVEGSYTFLPGYAYVELLKVGEEGEDALYEIVGTPLWNKAMALVRYRTGDLVRLPRGTGNDVLEAICYGVRAVSGVIGRDNDYLVSPDGGRVVGIDHIPRGIENVLRLQIVQEDVRTVRILVLPKAGFGPADRQQIAANLARKLPPTMTTSIEIVDELKRSEGGKTPLVIRRSAVPDLHP